MNYLSHHFFYSTDDLYHNVGLILPDLSRSAIGKRKVALEAGDHPSEFLAIQSGCLKHYEADEWFHDCAYFQSLSSLIDESISEQKLEGKFAKQRSWFLGHILSEMILDRLIIESDEDALNRFYKDLKQADIRQISGFLLQAGKTDTEHFEKVYAGFTSSEFIRYYSTTEGMVESLNRLVQRTKQSAFAPDETEFLSGQMDAWIEKARQIKKPHQMARLLK